ncbi:alpha/beta hydrolase family esterase [Sorangium sp. So ce233]|uniref:alpha/beta hydrolase family esterase n=1 Tax=Sorangium sp. So ce233 TaxID=3133290 RepID=UPI003F62C705
MIIRSKWSALFAASIAAASVMACEGDDSPSPPGEASGAGGGAVSGSASAGGATSGGATSSGSGGTGGSAASSGATGGGSGAAGGAGGGGVTSATQSAGCGRAASQALNEWIEQPTRTIASVERHWWVRLPENYDPARAYPVVFMFHGCSSATNNVPMQNVTGDDAILVRGAGVSDGICWDASSDGPDLAFFDQMLADVLANTCADTSRVFAVGYSSGAWLTNMLECKRGDKLRATGTVAGGTPGRPSGCVGQVARIFIHDVDDTSNSIESNHAERDRLLELNHCDAGAPPVPEDPAPCARYQGCDEGYPVIWCETSGQGHDRQDALAPGAFWGLFSEL